MFLSLFFVYIITASYDGNQSPDPMAAALPAWRFATQGDFFLNDFEGSIRWLIDAGEHIVSNRNPGVIFFGIPFYWAFSFITREFTLIPAAIAAATASAGAMTLLHVVFRRFVSASTAMLGALLAGLGTSTWTVSADGLWPHGINQLWFTTALVLLAHKRFTSSGIFFGLAIFTRPQTAIVAAVAGLYMTWSRRSLKPAVAIGVLSLVGVAGFLTYTDWIFGSVSLTGGYSHSPVRFVSSLGVTGYLRAILGTLFSYNRGVFVLSSFLLLLLPGLRKAWQVAPPAVRAGALSGLAYMMLHLAIIRYFGGLNFFSYRLPIEALTLAAPLFLLSWRETISKNSSHRRAFVAIALAAVFIHAFGAIFWEPFPECLSGYCHLLATSS